MLAVATLCAGFTAPDADSLSQMLKDVQQLVDARAKAYNCSFSVALKSPSLDGGKVHVVAAGGAEIDSKFAWGSITKMWTGASIMQLVANGVLSLEEPAAPHVDAQLAAMKKISFPGMDGFSKLSDLYGEDVNKVTIRNLLAMQSGIPDFDTANPSRVGPDKDTFRATVYAHPTTDYPEPTLMSEPWVAQHKLTSVPGEGFHYSSTNFGLLGLILAHHAGVADIRHLNQSVFIPPSLSKVNELIGWARTGSPAEHGVVVGYDRTDYNGQDPKKNPAGVDVSRVHGVFAGWAPRGSNPHRIRNCRSTPPADRAFAPHCGQLHRERFRGAHECRRRAGVRPVGIQQSAHACQVPRPHGA